MPFPPTPMVQRRLAQPSSSRQATPCRWRHVLALVTALWFGLHGLPASAQDAPYTEVQRLVHAGQLDAALQRAEAWLTDKPKDPQMRFLKGVIQNQTGQTDAAQDTYTQLTQDYPELPEPYNNLAVLHASQNRFDQARAALEMAIRLNPAYAMAHQNLGDVHARLAAESYARALAIDSANPPLRLKLQSLQTLLGATTGSQAR